jgi:hypothetical protein
MTVFQNNRKSIKLITKSYLFLEDASLINKIFIKHREYSKKIIKKKAKNIKVFQDTDRFQKKWGHLHILDFKIP